MFVVLLFVCAPCVCVCRDGACGCCCHFVCVRSTAVCASLRCRWVIVGLVYVCAPRQCMHRFWVLLFCHGVCAPRPSEKLVHLPDIPFTYVFPFSAVEAQCARKYVEESALCLLCAQSFMTVMCREPWAALGRRTAQLRLRRGGRLT